MENSINGRWIIPFKKFIWLRVIKYISHNSPGKNRSLRCIYGNVVNISLYSKPALYKLFIHSHISYTIYREKKKDVMYRNNQS